MNAQFVRETVVSPFSQPILPVVLEQTARQIFESFSEKMKAALNGRQERALKLALEGHVSHKAQRIFSVRSEDSKHSYLVDLDKGFCTCPDSQKGHVCKHRLAAYLVEQAHHPKQTQAAEASVSPEPEQPSSAPPPKNGSGDDAIERARLALNAKSQYLREAIIYAMLQTEEGVVPVELISLEGEAALVRALPTIKDGRLTPQFPFPERKSFARVLAKSLQDVKIYR